MNERLAHPLRIRGAVRSGPSWNHYGYTYGDDRRRVEVRFDLALATGRLPATHQHGVRLVVEADDAIERELADELADVDCLLVGVLRYGATVELVVQVEDLAAFGRVEARLAGRPKPVAVHRSRGWDYFTDRVCPREADWQRITDRETAEALVAGGLPADLPRPIAHTLVGGTEALTRAAAELVANGFDAPDVDGRRLVVVRAQRLVGEEISEVSTALGRLGRLHGLVYDGWRLVR